MTGLTAPSWPVANAQASPADGIVSDVDSFNRRARQRAVDGHLKLFHGEQDPPSRGNFGTSWTEENGTEPLAGIRS